jgi:ribonuclease HI
MNTIICYTDGGARGNPGPAAIGVYAVDAAGAVLLEHKETIGEVTNNVAEYQAVITALRRLGEQYGDRLGEYALEFRLDSELVVKQLRGEYKVKDANLAQLHGNIKSVLADLPHVTFVHVRREQNKEADRLVNEALDGK